MIKANFKQDLLSQQVRSYISKEIAAGKFRDGRLPPEESLALELGVSRLTLRHALASLEKDGIITRRRGIGTLINPKVVNLKARLDYEVECSEMLSNYGYEVEVQVLHVSYKNAGSIVADELGIPAKENVVEIQKLWFADKEPVILATDTIPIGLFEKDLPPIVEPVPIFNILNEYCNENVYYNITEVWADSAVNNEQNICHTMQIDQNTPVFIIKDVGYNKNNIPILYSYEVYRGDIMHFSLVRTRV